MAVFVSPAYTHVDTDRNEEELVGSHDLGWLKQAGPQYLEPGTGMVDESEEKIVGWSVATHQFLGRVT